MRDSFYVGYQPRSPRRTALFISVVSFLLVIVAAGLSMVLAATQDPPAETLYEFGTERTWTGLLTMSPYPSLVVADEEFLLVAPFKHTAAPLVQGFEGRQVSIGGTLISRDGIGMIEVNPASISGSGASLTAAPSFDATVPFNGTGEIVDSKCWLGVMVPGEKTVHRACARLCIRGGIPPMFVTESGAHFLVTDMNGDPIHDSILPFVARLVQIEGFVSRPAVGIPRLAVDTAQIRILTAAGGDTD